MDQTQFLLPESLNSHEEYQPLYNDPFLFRAMRKPAVRSSGSFSICVECKRIWDVSAASGAETGEASREYTGRLCPECLKNLYAKYAI